jgi:hypothetical protein
MMMVASSHARDTTGANRSSPAGHNTLGSSPKGRCRVGHQSGLITREQAYAMYRLSPEELASWEQAFERGGYRALSLKSRGAPG